MYSKNLKKRILFLQNSISRKSGGASSILDLAETTHYLGHDTLLGLTTGHLLNLLRKISGNSTAIPLQKIYTVPNSFNLAINNKQKSNLDKAKIKIVENLVRFGSIKNKLMNLLTQVDLIIIAALFTKKSLVEIKRISRAPIIYNHAGSPDTFENFWLRQEFFPEMSKRKRYINFCNLFDGILFQSCDQAEECIRRGAIQRSKSFVIEPSCSEKKVLAASQTKTPYSFQKKAIVCVGSIQKRKSQHWAVKVFAQLIHIYPEMELHFVGNISEKDYFESLVNNIKELGLEGKIFFHGHRYDYLKYMAHAEILIQTSKSEGVSRVLREAMLMRLPIISFAISGTSTLLRSGKDAILIPLYNIDMMAKAIISLINNKEKKNAVTYSAFLRYLENNSWSAYATKIKEMIQKIS